MSRSRLRGALLLILFASPWLVGWEMWPDVETRSLVTTDPDSPPWQEPLPEETPTRQTYFDTLDAWGDYQWWDRSTRWCGVESNGKVGYFAWEYASLYRATCDNGACDEEHAQRALDMLQRNYEYIECLQPPSYPSCGCAGTPVINGGHSASLGVAEASLLLQGSPTVTASDQTQIDSMISRLADEDYPNVQRNLRAVELRGAAALAASAAALPGDPNAPTWQVRSDLLFDDFALRWGHQGDAGHYVGQVTTPTIVRLVELRADSATIWADPGWLGFLDKFAALSFTGSLPNFGDSIGFPVWNTGSLYVWETAAARTGSSHYKWLAKRSWNMGARILDQNQLTLGQQQLEWWGPTAVSADDAVVAAPPASMPSQVLLRPAVSYDTDRHALLYATWQPHDQADKLVLSSGNDPDDGCYAVFNLNQFYSHGSREIGSLSLLWCDGSAIIIDGDTPYWSAGINKIDDDPVTYAQPARFIKRPYDESTAGIHHAATPYPGESIEFPQITLHGESSTGAQVTHFEDTAEWTSAWLEWDDPAGTGAQHEQRIYWYKGSPGLLWIRNRISMPAGGLTDVNYGHVLRAHDVHATSGTNWNAVFTAFSRNNNLPSRNVKRMAIAYFVPRVDQERRAFTIPDQQMPIAASIPGWPVGVPDCSSFSSDEPVSGLAPLGENPGADCRHGNRHALTQVRIEPGIATGSEWFDTILLPFDPDTESPTAAASRIAGHDLTPSGTGMTLTAMVGNTPVCVTDNGGPGEQLGFDCWREAVPAASPTALLALVLLLFATCVVAARRAA